VESTPHFLNKTTKIDNLSYDQISTTAATENKDSIQKVSKRSISEFEPNHQVQ
jgi:hypothetical protein